MAKVLLDFSVRTPGIRHRIHPARFLVQSTEPWHQHRKNSTKTEQLYLYVYHGTHISYAT
jgi:hypothetical protein